MGTPCEKEFLIGKTGNQADQGLAQLLNKDINRLISYFPDWPCIDILNEQIPRIQETSRVFGTVKALRIVNGLLINCSMEPSQEKDPILNFLFHCDTTPT